MPIFRIESVKIYTGIPVGSVTNFRYGQDTFQAGTFGGFPTSPFASGAQLEFNFHSFSLEEVRIFRHQHQEVGQIHPIRLPCSP